MDRQKTWQIKQEIQIFFLITIKKDLNSVLKIYSFMIF